MKNNNIFYIGILFLVLNIRIVCASNLPVSSEPASYKEFCNLCRVGEGEICASSAQFRHDPTAAETASLYERLPAHTPHPQGDNTLAEMHYLSSHPQTRLPLDMGRMLRHFSDEKIQGIIKELEIDTRGNPPRIALAEALNRLGTGVIGSMCKNYCKKEYLFPISYGREKWLFKIEHRPGLKLCLQKHYLDFTVLKNSKMTEQFNSSRRLITFPTTSDQELNITLNMLTTLIQDNLRLWGVINYIKIFPNGTKLPFKDFWIQKYYEALKAGEIFRELDPHGRAPMSLNPNSYGSPSALIESFSADIERTISMLLSYRDQLYSFLWFHSTHHTSFMALPQLVESISGVPSVGYMKNVPPKEPMLMPNARPGITGFQSPMPPYLPGFSQNLHIPPQSNLMPPSYGHHSIPMTNPQMAMPPSQRSFGNVNYSVNSQSQGVFSPASPTLMPLQSQTPLDIRPGVPPPSGNVSRPTYRTPSTLSPFQQTFNRSLQASNISEPFLQPLYRTPFSRENTLYVQPKIPSTQVFARNLYPPPSLVWNQQRSILPYSSQTPMNQFSPGDLNPLHSVPYDMNGITGTPFSYMTYGFQNQNVNSFSSPLSIQPQMTPLSYYNVLSLQENPVPYSSTQREWTASNTAYKYDPTELKRILEDIRLNTD